MDLEHGIPVAEKFLKDFTMNQEYWQGDEPLIIVQYVAPTEAKDAIEVMFTCEASADETSPELQALAEKAVAALEAAHPELGEIVWDLSSA